jgi:hypothetical protein
MNAMALIAPGAFLWLTFQIQATTGVTAPSMWIGIVVALLLCLATAVCYAEMAKLYPGTGSSYYFAEQAFLSHEKAWRYARLAKFVVGWGSHVYYWVYPGVMVGVMGILCGYLVGTLWPNFMNASNPGPAFMMAVAIAFSFLVGYIAHRGINGSTAVSIAINVVQISALVLFSVLALSYRINHAPGSVAYQFDSTSGEAYNYEFAMEKTVVNGQATDNIVRDSSGAPKPKLDAAGKPVPYRISFPKQDEKGNFLAHSTPASVVGIHNLGWSFIQATVAILILVGFESVTVMGGEAKNARRDIPIAVIVSLLVQGLFCYLFEYFAANYFQRLYHAKRRRFGGAHWRHDDRGGHRHLRPRRRPDLHAVRGVYRVSGSDRHHAFMHEHRCPGNLRHGKRSRTARILWRAACQESEPASRHLDPGRNFGGDRLCCGHHAFRRCGCSDRCSHQSAAAGFLVELRIHHTRRHGGSAPFPAYYDSGVELRNFPALRAKLHHLSGGLP